MKRRRIIITDTQVRVNTGNLVSKLRRIRNELALMLAQVDEALTRIEVETS
jgi:hypothetical protein